MNEHNATIPRDHWLEDWEKKVIVNFHAQYPLEGYRRLTFMMLDRDLVAVSPSSVYRALKNAGLLERFNGKPSRPTNTGTSIFPTSTSPVRFTTSAACSTGAAASSSTGKFAKR